MTNYVRTRRQSNPERPELRSISPRRNVAVPLRFYMHPGSTFLKALRCRSGFMPDGFRRKVDIPPFPLRGRA